MLSRLIAIVLFWTGSLWFNVYLWFVPPYLKFHPDPVHSFGWRIFALASMVVTFVLYGTARDAIVYVLKKTVGTSTRSYFKLVQQPIAAICMVGYIRVITSAFHIAQASPREVLAWFLIFSAASPVYFLGRRVFAPAITDLGQNAEAALAEFIMTPEASANKDGLPTILYLRSFENELNKSLPRMGTLDLWRDREGAYVLAGTGNDLFDRRSRLGALLGVRRGTFDEQMLFGRFFSSFGDYFALGRPGETYQNLDLGARKRYVADAQWKTVVREVLLTCSAVVIEAAHTDSLLWELSLVVEIVEPTRVLLILPHDRHSYKSFLLLANSIFPKPLPGTRPPSRLVTFDPSWNVVVLENINHTLWGALEPFCVACGLVLEDATT